MTDLCDINLSKSSVEKSTLLLDFHSRLFKIKSKTSLHLKFEIALNIQQTSFFPNLAAHLLQALCHVDDPPTPQDFAAERIVIVETVVLLRLHEHLAQRFELRDLLREKSLPGHVEFVRMATLPGEVGKH